MSDFESGAAERLRAANPVASATYEHADFNAMMRRIMKQPRRGALTFAKGFRLKMASAVGASALVTAGDWNITANFGTWWRPQCAGALFVFIGKVEYGTWHHRGASANLDDLPRSTNVFCGRECTVECNVKCSRLLRNCTKGY